MVVFFKGFCAHDADDTGGNSRRRRQAELRRKKAQEERELKDSGELDFEDFFKDFDI